MSGKTDSVRKAYVFCAAGGDDVDPMVRETGPYKDYKIEGPYKIIDACHWPMVTKPRELAEDLIHLVG